MPNRRIRASTGRANATTIRVTPAHCNAQSLSRFPTLRVLNGVADAIDGGSARRCRTHQGRTSLRKWAHQSAMRDGGSACSYRLSRSCTTSYDAEMSFGSRGSRVQISPSRLLRMAQPSGKQPVTRLSCGGRDQHRRPRLIDRVDHIDRRRVILLLERVGVVIPHDPALLPISPATLTGLTPGGSGAKRRCVAGRSGYGPPDG